MRVLKFGGSSVANAERIQQMLSLVNDYVNNNSSDITIVVSALGGVTDLLVQLSNNAIQNKQTGSNIIDELENKHIMVIKELIPAHSQPYVIAETLSMFKELSNVLKGVSLVNELSPRSKDLILSFGERLSAFIITNALMFKVKCANYTDARYLIKTDSNYGNAKVNFEVTNKSIKEYYRKNDTLNVVTGFIASNSNGYTTTLGRSGSDYTAAIIGAALNAEVVEIWTDVDGVMSADPRFVPEAKSIDKLTYKEAMELSHFGAKVIFPSTMQPLMDKNIPLLVKNTFNPSFPGTLISNDPGNNRGVIKGITVLNNISLINVEGCGMVGVAGISARIFKALHNVNVSVILISQASSEHSICFAIVSENEKKALEALRLEFREELKIATISSITSESNLSIIAAVGESMKEKSGVSAKIFAPLGRNGINIKALSQGSSELNISLVIKQKDMLKSLRVLHQSLFNYDEVQLHLFVVGTGKIGNKLLELINEQFPNLKEQKISLQVNGICNRKNMLLSENNINLDKWESVLKNVGSETSLKLFTERIIEMNFENSVFIDLTASDLPVKYYEYLMKNHVAVVTSNKRGNTQRMEKYKLLKDASKKRNTSFHYETNVAAGLPLINVIKSLEASGDRITKIEAVLSGTINYLLSEYNGKTPFSHLVKKANKLGYTEPDPREDLNGVDVARKCLILARECNWNCELEDIKIERLMPDDISLENDLFGFYNELAAFDLIFHQKYIQAKNNKCRLRYVASIQKNEISISLMEVNEFHPFYNLRGTENCISINSKFYTQYPMVIKGPGAGIETTSSGVLADIVRVAESLK